MVWLQEASRKTISIWDTLYRFQNSKTNKKQAKNREKKYLSAHEWLRFEARAKWSVSYKNQTTFYEINFSENVWYIHFFDPHLTFPTVSCSSLLHRLHFSFQRKNCYEWFGKLAKIAFTIPLNSTNFCKCYQSNRGITRKIHSEMHSGKVETVAKKSGLAKN